MFRKYYTSKSSPSPSPSLISTQPPRKTRFFLTASLTFLSLNSFAVYAHFHDDIFHSYYPFPIAFDVGNGPSMLPTIDNSLYLRDCWSHRFLWFNYAHFKKCAVSLLRYLSREETKEEDRIHCNGEDNDVNVPMTLSSLSFSRPWQRGDIVTLFNPYTKSLVTKRIVAVAGDNVCVFGEYALELFHQKQYQHREQHHKERNVIEGANHGYDANGDAIVPLDTRFPQPFCQTVQSTRRQEHIQGNPQLYTSTFIEVPPKNVWLEGDNPMYSTDSRHYGPIPESALRGRIIRRILPLGTVLDSRRPPLPQSSATKTNIK